MLRKITWQQFMEWRAFQQLEPPDAATAIIAMILAEVNRDRKKRPTAYTLEDFLLNYDRMQQKQGRRRTQTWQQQKQIAIAIATAYSHRANQQARR